MDIEDIITAAVIFAVGVLVLALAFIVGRWLLRKIFIRAPKRDTEAYLRFISPREFEAYMTRLFALMGYDARLTPATSDGGKDIVLRDEGEVIYVECKQWEEGAFVGPPELQKLAGAAALDSVGEIIFVATCRYSETAERAAAQSRTMKVTLWTMDDILRAIRMVKEETGVKYIEE